MTHSPLTVFVSRLRPGFEDLPLPAYESPLAAGLDLRAAIGEPLILEPLERALVPSGLAVAIPEGFEGQVRPRSGLALKQGLGILNSPGTIDADYRGEIGVIVINLGREPITITRGQRIAQLVIAPVVRAELRLVAELDTTVRAAGGFGHTGS